MPTEREAMTNNMDANNIDFTLINFIVSFAVVVCRYEIGLMSFKYQKRRKKKKFEMSSNNTV